MQMHQVHYFVALSEERSFTRAARRCHVAQPSLTRAIKLLEEELGGALFDRHREGVRLTDLGILVRSDLAQIEHSAALVKHKAAQFLTAGWSTKHQHEGMEALMRAHHVVAILAVLIVGWGTKQFLFSAPQAQANLSASESASPIQMHVGYPNMDRLPVQKLNDRSFVFPESD
jgi:hypothetical protein